jgi:uncharacterized surface protein with fasciclin (FAS1) repeats
MNSMTRIITRLLVVSLLAFVAACSDTSDKVIYDGALPTAPAADTPSSDPEPEPGNIVEVADGAGSFTTLLAAAQKAGLVDALSDDGASLTVFAPSDEAFAALGVSIDDLSAEALKGILEYHVLDGAVSVDEAGALAPTTVATLNGANIAVTAGDDEHLYVNFAKVTAYDIEASNGLIHVIDSVLLPPDTSMSDSTITDIVGASDDFSTLEAAATAANLLVDLADTEMSYTVFAPTDAAFAELGDETIDYLLSDMDLLVNTLEYHIVSGATLFSSDAIVAAAKGDMIAMSNGDQAVVTLDDGMLMIDNSTIVTTDIVASNGVIHVIDVVMDAPSSMPAPLSVTLAADGEFSQLSALLEEAGLTETLLDPNANLTIFAPTDDAFGQMKASPSYQRKGSGDHLADFSEGAFDGSGAVVDSVTETYTFPSTAQSWAGFANNAADIYPLTFSEGGTITFTAAAETPTSLFFRFEDLPYPNVGVTFDSPTVLVNSATPTEYSVELPAQGDQTFASFLLYLVDQDQAVTITNVVVNTGVAEEQADPELVDLLSYHVYGDKVLAADVVALAGNSIQMENGKPAAISVDSEGNVLINDARIVTTDIVAGNGVIHAINKVLTLPGEPTSVIADFSEGAFDGSGAVVDSVTETYTFPSTAQSWAGFANNADIYPLTFSEGGTITFTAAAETPTSLFFRFEDLPYPNVGVTFDSPTVLVNSATPTEYSVELPAQGDQTFASFLLYLVDQDQAVTITNVVVTSGTATDEGSAGSSGSVADFSEGAFDGSGAVVDSVTETYTFPSTAQSWAGFANNAADIYPLTFSEGGTITFTAAAETPTSLFFRFEDLPYPNVGVTFDSPTVLVNSATPTEYSVELPAQGDQTFASFLLYLVDQDQAVTITNVVVTSGTATDEGSAGSSGSVADFSEGAFDGSGAVVDSVTETYTFPSTAQSWAGFANNAADIYPLTFSEGGTITFTAAAETPTSLFFRFEDLPYPNVGVTFDSPTVLVNSATPTEYSVELPAQGDQTFASFLLYLVDQDQAVTITNVVVTSGTATDEGSAGSSGSVADFSEGAFDGSGAVVDSVTETYTFPSTAQSWAGFANNAADIYPLTFSEGGTITFTAAAETPTSLFFRFEDLPYPNVGVTFDSPTVLVNSATPTEYSVELPAQGDQTFASFLLYLVDQDQAVTITNVVVTES